MVTREDEIAGLQARRGGQLRLNLAKPGEQQLAMLQILYGACSGALDAFKAADNPVDEELVTDLESMLTRTHGEIERLSALLARDAA
jgi:hypothetical protein